MARRAHAAETPPAETLASDAHSNRTMPALSLVEPPPPGAKALGLFRDARAASLDHLAEVEAAMAVLRERLETVVEAGDLYVVGVQAFAERLAEELFWKGKSFELLVQRQREGAGPAARRR
ncbi:MAG TPA: hypothetical protein VMT68_00030 [Caulobacteraceae bacterium]|nr:hypothetical protein [Caulobacteraceae bacterium]